MKFYTSQSTLSKEYLNVNDLIHSKKELSFDGLFPEEDSVQVMNFFSTEELLEIKKVYFQNFQKEGMVINGTYCMLANPFSFGGIMDVVKERIKDHLGKDIVFYFDVSNDPIPVGDHFYLMTRAYYPHTDSIVHIPGYAPYKDVIIPITINGPEELFYYTCNQRYYKRATHFKYGFQSSYFSNYANIINNMSYSDYGVKYTDELGFDKKFFEKQIKASNIPYSVFQSLSLDKVFNWVPGSIIVHDQSVLHAPTSLRAQNCSWKLGLTLHLLKKENSFRNKTFDNYTSYSPYTLPFLETTYVDNGVNKIPLSLLSGEN